MKRDNKRSKKVYLNVKERELLKILLKNGRTSNSKVARKLKVTPQAVGMMRRKLESIGIIKDYTVELDLDHMGINTFVIVLFDMDPLHEDKLITPNMISFCKVITNSATHIALYAFEDLDKMDDHFKKLESENSDILRIVEMHVCPTKGVLEKSSRSLFYDALKNYSKDQHYLPLDIPYHAPRKRKKQSRKLTLNEKKVLKFFIKDGKIPCRKISAKLGEPKITGNSINRIKMRLERRKIIKGYSVRLDYKKLGINVFAFILMSRKSSFLDEYGCLTKWARNSPNVTSCLRLNEDNMYALFCGFKNLEELKNYCHLLQIKNKDLFKIKHIYITSPDDIIKDSLDNLFLSLL